jgi:hypothetical protein
MRFAEIAERLCDACLAKFGEDPIPEQVCPACRKRLEKLLKEWRDEFIEILAKEKP